MTAHCFRYFGDVSYTNCRDIITLVIIFVYGFKRTYVPYQVFKELTQLSGYV